MPKFPVFSGKNLLKFVQFLGFEITRINGSHYRLKHPDGRVTTIPLHGNEDIPKGLLRKIIREDIGLEIDDFISLYEKYNS